MKRKLVESCSSASKRNRMHTVKFNLITLHEIRYWFVFQMTIKRSLSRWLGIYASYSYFLFPCALHGFKNQEMIAECMVWKSALIIINKKIHLLNPFLYLVTHHNLFQPLCVVSLNVAISFPPFLVLQLLSIWQSLMEEFSTVLWPWSSLLSKSHFSRLVQRRLLWRK